MQLQLSSDDLLILVCALDSYMYDLAEREKRADYWFRSHMIERYKQESENNRVLLLSRMRRVDDLRERFLMEIPYHQV